jgi:hypothetical protein
MFSYFPQQWTRRDCADANENGNGASSVGNLADDVDVGQQRRNDAKLAL